MRIFTCLAVALLSVSSISVFSQNSNSGLKGNLRFDNSLDTYGKSYAPGSTPMVLTSDDQIIVTGTAYSNAESYSPGAFVALSSKELPTAPQWRIIFDGSSVITAAVADDNGGVYVGGNFRNKLILPGVNGDKITLEGSESYGEKKSVFLAHINKEGKVVAAQAVNSTADPTMIEKYPDTFNTDAAFCNLNSLTFADGKLYAGLTFSNLIKNQDGSKSLTSSSYDLSSMGMGVGSNTAFVAAHIDLTSMGVAEFPVVFGGNGSYQNPNYWGLDVTSTKMVGEGTHLYFVAQVFGYTNSGTLWLSGTEKDNGIFASAGGTNAYYIANIDMASNSVVSKVYDGKYEYSSATTDPAIGALQVKDGKLYLAGSFMQNCPVATDKKAVGNTDLFAAVLDKNDLSVTKVLTSGFDETASGNDANQEYLSFFVTAGSNMLSLTGYVGKKNENAEYKLIDRIRPLLYNVDDYSVESKMDNDTEESDDYITGGLVTDNNVYSAFLTNNLFSYYYGYEELEATGINNIGADKLSNHKAIYNIQGMKLKTTKKGLNIINGKKVILK